MQLFHNAFTSSRLDFQISKATHPNLYLKWFDGKKRVRAECSKFSMADITYVGGLGIEV